MTTIYDLDSTDLELLEALTRLPAMLADIRKAVSATGSAFLAEILDEAASYADLAIRQNEGQGKIGGWTTWTLEVKAMHASVMGMVEASMHAPGGRFMMFAPEKVLKLIPAEMRSA